MRSTGPSADVVEGVFERDGHSCVLCSVLLFTADRGWQWAVHHRKGRGQPDSHEPQNLITVCGASNIERCHGRIHASRVESQRFGWLFSRNARPALDPLQVPVLVDRESRWVHLTADYQYAEGPPL